MRAQILVAAVILTSACAPSLYAQSATAPVQPNATPGPATSAPATPAPATSAAATTTATPAAAADANAGKPIVCEATASQGDLVSLHQCISQDEARRRRARQQEQLRQFQMRSLMFQPH